MKPLLLQRDGNHTNTFARPAPDWVDARVLAAAVAETHAVPTGARFVIFSATGNFYAKAGTSVAAPAAVSVTADNTTDFLTAVAHGLSNGDAIILKGTMPTGLTLNQTYYVRDKTADTFKLAATAGGAAINFTTDGSGLTFVAMNGSSGELSPTIWDLTGVTSISLISPLASIVTLSFYKFSN